MANKHEKMFGITGDQGKANQAHNEINITCIYLIGKIFKSNITMC